MERLKTWEVKVYEGITIYVLKSPSKGDGLENKTVIVVLIISGKGENHLKMKR